MSKCDHGMVYGPPPMAVNDEKDLAVWKDVDIEGAKKRLCEKLAESKQGQDKEDGWDRTGSPSWIIYGVDECLARLDAVAKRIEECVTRIEAERREKK